MANKNYFSTRITIGERLTEVGLPSTSSNIQRVGELNARLINILDYPSLDPNFAQGPSKGKLSMSIETSDELSGTVTLQDPSNNNLALGVSVPPPGTLGYFAADKIPEGWMALGDPFAPFKHKILTGYVNGDPLQPLYANTEFNEIYEILKSWNLIESERRVSSGREFNTKDPFKGYFIRSLNPDATGVDSGNVPLQTQESSISTHSHSGLDFPSMVDPRSEYVAKGTFFSSSPTYYNFDLTFSGLRTSNTSPEWVPGANNTTTRNLNTLVMNYRDTLTLDMDFPGVVSSAEAFTLGTTNYDGNYEPFNDRELEYYIITNPGTPGEVSTSHSFYTGFKSAFDTQKKLPGSWRARVVFKPKKVLSSQVYVINEQALYNNGFNGYSNARPPQSFILYSFENSQFIDKGRIPFHEEILEDPLAIRDSVLGAPGPIPYSVGTQYFYNYKWMFGSNWNIIDDGTTQVNYNNYFRPPFHFTDGNGVTHSVTNWDNHIHTRIETYYRSIYNTLYGKVAVPTSPAIAPLVHSNYWRSQGPNKNLLPSVSGLPVGTNVYVGGSSGLLAPTSTPNGQYTADGWVSQGQFSDSFLGLIGAKGYVKGSTSGTGAPGNSGQLATYDTPGLPNDMRPFLANLKYAPELDVTYETPYWLRSYYTFMTVWDYNSESYSADIDPATTPSGKITKSIVGGNYPAYTVRSTRTVTSYTEKVATYNQGQFAGYRSWPTSRTYYTTKETVYNSPAVPTSQGDDLTTLYGTPSSYNQQLLRRTWRTRNIGPRRTFALRRYLTNAEVALHIYKSEPGTPLGNEYYNTGDDGNLAIRTDFQGNHDHELAHDESYYRGEDQFRPINIALRLCVKY